MKKDKPTKKTPAAKKPKRHAATPVDQPMVAATPASSATAAVPPLTPEAPPLTPEARKTSEAPEAPPRIEVIEVPRIYEAILAEHLRNALGFVLPACPKEGPFSEVIFGEMDGRPFIAARDRTRLHLAFLPPSKGWRIVGTAERGRVRKAHRLLGSLEESDEATVTCDVLGRLMIRRAGQPELCHALDVRPSVLDWEPPLDLREATSAPLALPSDHLLRAVRYPGGTVEIVQRTSARAVVTITVGGTVVARATLAERGTELYPDPQERFEFARTPTSTPEAIARVALRELQRDLEAMGLRADGDGRRSDIAEAPAPLAVVDGPANDAAPAEASSAFPTPKDDVNVVLSLSAAAVATLEARGTLTFLRTLSFLSLADVGNGERASGPLTPAEVAAVAAILAGDGLRCVDVTPAEHDDDEACEEWRVDVAGEPKGAAV